MKTNLPLKVALAAASITAIGIVAIAIEKPQPIEQRVEIVRPALAPAPVIEAIRPTIPLRPPPPPAPVPTKPVQPFPAPAR